MDVNFDNRLGTVALKFDMEEPRLAADAANKVTDELEVHTCPKRGASVTAQRVY